MSTAYLQWLTIFVWAPLALLWATNWRLLRGYPRTFTRCIGWALVFSVPWDVLAVRTQIWLFPKEGNLGIWIFGLPLEEYLFMVFVTLLVSTVTIVLRARLFPGQDRP